MAWAFALATAPGRRTSARASALRTLLAGRGSFAAPPGPFKTLGRHGARVLRSSFVLLPRVGLVTEARLWGTGCTTWDAYRAAPSRLVRGLTADGFTHHLDLLAAADAAVGRDPAFFAWNLPNGEHWRAFDDFAEDAAYVDIETDGGREVTVLGVRRRGRTRTLVLGDDLTPASATEALAGASCLVTFNGASFDLPVLRNMGAETPLVPHLDLLPATRRLGLRGGLKKVEAALGLRRDAALEGLTGWDAVLLWDRHRRGDAAALETLLAYNRADVDNLEPLARVTVDGLAAQARARMVGPAQLRLA